MNDTQRTLAEFRAYYGHSQTAVAQACACSSSHISNMERRGATCEYEPGIEYLEIFIDGELARTGRFFNE